MKKIVNKILGKKKTKDIFSEYIENEGMNALYKSMVKKNVIMIYAVDVKGIVRLSEGKGLKAIGVKPGELVGSDILDLYKDFPKIVKGFKSAFKGSHVSHITTVAGVSFVTTLSPIRNKKGVIVGAQGTSINVTEELQLEEKLKESEESYRSIFEQSTDAIFIHDINTGEIIDVNQKMIDMYGYSKKEALKGSVKTISSGIAPYDQAGATEKVKLAASGKPQVFEWHAKTKKGKLFWVEVSLGKVVIGGIDRIIASVRDISERKVVEEQLIHISKMKNEFLSIAAHQLRTPLGAMRWNMELLLSKEREYKLDHEVKDLLQKTYKSNIKVIHLVNDLLDVSRIDQNRVKVLVEKFSVVDALNSVIEQLEYEFKVKQLKLQFRIEKAHKYNVELGKRQFTDVVNNLVHNAIKYSEPKSKIFVSLEKKENFYIFKIRNKGIGIKENDKKHIYEKFFRGRNAVKTGTSGSGLGLFIAKSFVEGWGGSINFVSRENETTTFTFTIPIKRK